MSATTVTYVIPEYNDIQLIERDRVLTLQVESAIGRYFPMGSEVGRAVSWDKRDSVTGLIPVKGLGGPLVPLQATGGIRRSVSASYWGAEMPMDVTKVIAGGKYGSVADRIDIGEELDIMSAELAYKERQTMDLQLGRMLSDGVINTYDKDGNVVDTLALEAYATRFLALTGNAKWTAKTTATPITDMRRVADQYFRGTGYSVVQGVMMMTTKAFNIMMETDEIKKNIKNKFGASVIVGVDEFNQMYKGIFPFIELIDGGANLPSGWIPYLTDNHVVFIGKHATRGTQAGKWVVTTSEKPGVGESVYSNVLVPAPFPSLPIVERAFQGAPFLYSDDQYFVLEIGSTSDVDNYYG